MSKGKRIISFLMSIVMSLGVFSGMTSTVFADTKQMTAYILDVPRSGDNSTNPSDWGHPAFDFMGNWSTPEKKSRYSMYFQDSFEGKAMYCIEPGVGVHTGDQYDGFDETFWNNYPSGLNPTIAPTIIKAYIGRIMQYGWQGNGETSWDMSNPTHTKEVAHYIATQLLIWETVVGERDSQFNKVDAHAQGKANIKDTIKDSHPLRDLIFQYYTDMEKKVQQHTMLPSFFTRSSGSADTYELKWNGTDYSVTLTDTNGVLGNYSFSSSTSGMKFEVNGNKLTIRCNEAPKDAVSIMAEKKNGERKGVVIWSDGNIGGGKQDFTTYGATVSDPVTGYLKLEIMVGNMHLLKTSEDGKVSGISFTISGEGYHEVKTTNEDGVIDISDLNPGVYTVTEQVIDKYEPQEVQRVTIVSGKTSTVTFNNTLKRGSLKVTKTSEDGLTEGMKFHLYGTSLAGIPVDEYAVTDSSGIATFDNVLISGSTPYILEEVDTAIRYVIPEAQNTTVQWNEVTNQSVHNVLKKFRVTVTKSDAETGEAQGDASLAGATYGLYKGETLVDSFTTDSNGSFTTGYYVCDTDWTIREINPSEGYLLDPTIYPVGADPELYTVELNTTANDVKEQVQKGNIALIKHTDDGETGIETPESGAEFQVYLKSSGSYDAAADSERDFLTCDENGYAKTKDLPYGIYTVHQVSGWEGRDLIDDFDVFIAKDGQTYHYILNNRVFESHIKIIKVDAETGKTIPYAGAGFQLFKPDGTQITQTITYPEVTTIDTFYTNDKGYLITPEPLEYGSGYSLVEVYAPYGYVVNSDPVYFDVTEEGSTEEDGVTIIEVEKSNVAQKGVIHIKKTGEVFSSVTESDGIYQPVYSVQGLPGAVYEITAAEDIYTLDGTLRYSAGEVVDTIETDKSGIATSKELYLGKFNVKEIQAPYPMVLNDEIHEVELVYAGQDVEITEAETGFYNERQKVKVSIQKALEQDELFGLGMNGEITSVTFGLFAAEDITAADGSIIPADGQIEVVSVSEDGIAVCTSDLPIGSYYLQELSVDGHYIISDEKYPFVFEYGGQDVPLIEIAANDGAAVDNTLKRGEIQGKKVDEDGNALGGAIIGLFRPDCTEFTEENALMTTTSADDGSFSFKNIPLGDWVIREISQPTGFVLSDESFPVSITEDKQVIEIEIEIENAFITGNLHLTKYDADFPENKLSGAVFEVFRDSNGNKELDDEDELLGTMEETLKGIYEMNDIRYGGVLVREKTAPEGFVLDENVYYIMIDTDGKTYEVENEAGKGFINQAQKGSLKIIKTSSDGTKKGFEFRVTGPNGYDQTFVTDESGEILIENLRIGEYVVTELKNSGSANYKIADPVTVEIVADEVLTVNVYNEKTTVDVPKTGDETNLGLWIGLMICGLTGIAGTTIVCLRKRRKTKNDQ